MTCETTKNNVTEKGAFVEIKHLTKKYGPNVAVNDLNLTLEAGHIYGFLGPNGAGKSTTMNIITGYIGATSGEVIINGYDINKQPNEAKKCIGYLPELPPVYGDMKVFEYLRFVAELKNIDKHQQQADILQVMDLTKLHSVKNRLIKNLSKGYRQRVGLAQALMGMPEIIILDEPTVGLDPKQIIEIRELIKSLGEKHIVILSSHILQEISAVCDHVFIISKGNLVASDAMEHLESQMSGAQLLSVVVKGTREQAESFADVAGVKSCEVTQEIQPEETSEMVQEAVLKLEEPSEETAEEVATAETSEDASEEIAEKVHNITEKEIHLTLTAKPDTDIREAVFRHCVSENIVLLEMKADKKTLEDVFLELTDSKEVQAS
jgi:ABC-2 type transport system ATP-binding protein